MNAGDGRASLSHVGGPQHGPIKGNGCQPMQMNHILVPVDGSQAALKAVDLASNLAGKFGAKLTLLHVVEDIAMSEDLKRFAELEHLPDEPEKMHLEVIAKAILDEARRQAATLGVAQPQTEVRQGNPAMEILDYAEGNGVDTIVIGNEGLGRIEGWLLGSVSQKVNYLSTCTCITVK